MILEPSFYQMLFTIILFVVLIIFSKKLRTLPISSNSKNVIKSFIAFLISFSIFMWIFSGLIMVGNSLPPPDVKTTTNIQDEIMAIKGAIIPSTFFASIFFLGGLIHAAIKSLRK